MPGRSENVRARNGLACALDLQEDWFADKTDRHQCALRALNYPHQDTPPLPGQLRAGAHTDYGALTILTLSASGSIDGGAFGWAGAISPPEAQTLLLVMLWNGLIPSAFTTWAQTYGQAAVSPSAANVLYSFQPVWNAGIAAMILHEKITPSEIAGGAFIILAAILAAAWTFPRPSILIWGTTTTPSTPPAIFRNVG